MDNKCNFMVFIQLLPALILPP